VLLGAGLLVMLAGMGLATMQWHTAPKHQITSEQTEKIQPGMSSADVEALFGVPPGLYTAGDHVQFAFPMGPNGRHVSDEDRQRCTRLVWVGDDVGVQVFFEENGKVLSYEHLWPIRTRELFLERLCRWLGL
jgi:hypothetical protein